MKIFLRVLVCAGLGLAVTGHTQLFEAGSSKNIGARTTLRFNPSHDGPVAAIIDEGTPVEILTTHESGGWAWVRAYQAQGWITQEDWEAITVHDEENEISGAETLHHLARIQEYFTAHVSGYFGGTYLKEIHTQMTVDNYSSGFVGAGFGCRLMEPDPKGWTLLADFVASAHIERVGADRGVFSESLEGRFRYLEVLTEDTAWGAFSGLGYYRSGYSQEGESPVNQNPSSFYVPLGISVSGDLESRRDLVWMGDLWFSAGLYPGIGISFRILKGF